MHPAIYLPILVSSIVNMSVTPDYGAIALTAYDPVLSAAMTIDYGLIVATAPSPEANGTLELGVTDMVATALDPISTGGGDSIIVPDYGTIILTALDPIGTAPSTLFLPVAGIALTAKSPIVDYAFVTSSNDPATAYRAPPIQSTSGAEHRRQLAQSSTRMLQGKLNATGTVTLLANVPLTPLRDARLSPESFVRFDPLTAHANTEQTNGTMIVLEANRQEGQWLITHANNAQTDRKFRFVVLA